MPVSFTLVPFCVSGFTFNLTLPSIVSAVISPPKIAVYKSKSTVENKLSSTNLNLVSFLILKVIYKSPLGPPFAPKPPLPEILIFCSFFTPAGIVSRIFFPLSINICC